MGKFKAALRYARLIVQLFILRGRIANPIHICLTIDFDLDMKYPEEGYRLLERLLTRHGLTGRVTYLINPMFDLGGQSALYREIFENGNEVGLHTHAESLILQNDETALLALIEKQKALVEERFGHFDAAFRIHSFRSVCRVFSPALFRVLKQVGIRYDSTMCHHQRHKHIFNAHIEDGCSAKRVYYLTPETYREESPAPTELVEIPVTSQIPEVKELAGALRPGEPLIVATFVHPVNFHDAGRTHWLFLLFYRFVLSCLIRLKGARFSHLNEAGQAWEAWRQASKF